MSLTISLTPLEVEQRLASLGIVCSFTPEEHTAYATTPVVSGPQRVLGFPTPTRNESLTLQNIKGCVGVDPGHQPAFFEHPWYQSEEFMTKSCVPGWHFLMMDPIPGSIRQSLDYVRSSDRLELPQAVEVVLMLFLHYVGTGEQLLMRKHSWCADVASMNRAVTVGAFGRNGVFLSGHPPNFASQGLGICAKIAIP